MPIYEYRCTGCGAHNEILVGVSAETSGQSLACETCGSASLERLLSRINSGVRLSGDVAPCGAPQGSGESGFRGAGCCGGSCHGH